MKKRVVVTVIDGFGVGSLPDAASYGDVGSNTLKTIYDAGIQLELLPKLGLYTAAGLPYDGNLIGSSAKQTEASAGKDTPVGHWEICGAITHAPLPTYPNGFPDDVIKKLEVAFGTKVIGNVAESGTEIISRLGDEHCQTGYPIVYTSADSVLQIAAHEAIVPLSKLYQFCKFARDIMTDQHAVGRIVARPFHGEAGNYQRTANRHDYALSPPHNLLDILMEADIETVGIGKISDIFSGRGISKGIATKGNTDGLKKQEEELKKLDKGFIFTNLVDTDMLYGHRNDIKGYKQCVEEVDRELSKLTKLMTKDDLLIVTGDHGCDPGYPGTDHTREYTPALIYDPANEAGRYLGVTDTFACIAATVAEALGVDYNLCGKSLLK